MTSWMTKPPFSVFFKDKEQSLKFAKHADRDVPTNINQLM